MPAITHECDLKQAFDYEADKQVRIGQVLSLKIGEQEFAADFTSKDLESQPPADLKCVGILQSVEWGGGYTDPIALKFVVSTKNKQDLSSLVHGTLKSTAVEFKFQVFDFDPLAESGQGKYYKTLADADSTPLYGLIKKESGALQITVNKDPAETIQSPLNYEVTLTCVPKPQEMHVNVANANQKTVTKRWGSAN